MEGGFLKSFLTLLPEIPSANRKISTKEQVTYSIISYCILAVGSQLPLYGIDSATGGDPFYWIRLILTSNRGTLMELGIIPILVSRMVMQLLACSELIALGNDVPEDRNLLNGVQKLLDILITVGAAVTYVLSGMHGSINQLGTKNAILIMLQLCLATFIVIYLDELFQKRYALVPATSLFISTNISSVHWSEYPFFPIVYIVLILSACCFFWEMWNKDSSLSTRDLVERCVAEALLRNDVGSWPV